MGAAHNRCILVSWPPGRHMGRGQRPHVWMSNPNCGGGALLTAMAAMQSSVVSLMVHCRAPPLTTLHSSHLTLSWWPTAHHSALQESSTPRTGGEKPGIQKKSEDVSGSLLLLATEWLPNGALTDSSRVGMSRTHITAPFLPITLQEKWGTQYTEKVVKAEQLPTLLTSSP